MRRRHCDTDQRSARRRRLVFRIEIPDLLWRGLGAYAIRCVPKHHISLRVNVTILEGAEVRIGFYGRGGRILRGDTSEGAEGPEGWPRG